MTTDKLVLFIGDWIIVDAQGVGALITLIVLSLFSGALAFLYWRVKSSQRNAG